MIKTNMAGNEVEIKTPDYTLHGNLAMTDEGRGLVLFAHGSGSSRFSPRNRFVAGQLQKGGLSTLLFDLLTPDEERIDNVTRELRFDVDLLSERLVRAIFSLSLLE